MRGVAALAAALSAWVLVGGGVPRWRMPHITWPSFRIALASLTTGLLTTALAQSVLGVPVAAVALGTLAAAMPLAFEAHRRRAETASIGESWPDLLTFVRTRITAGETLPDAFVEALRSAPSRLRDHAQRVDDAVRYGAGFSQALEEMQVELADPTTDRVLTTLATAQRSGGRRVAEIVAALATSVADEQRLRKAHDSALTEQRMTATVALFAPWALLALTLVTNPQSAAAFRTGSGSVVVLIGLAATGIGFILARRAIRLSRPPRLFE